MLRFTVVAFAALFGACSDPSSGVDPDARVDASNDVTPDTSIPDTRPDVDTTVPIDTTVPTDATVADSDVPAEVSQPTVVLTVTVPASTPADASIFVSGNQPELGNWDGVGTALTRGTDGRWSVGLSFPVGTTLAFKITRGSWDTVEKDATGGEIADRTHTVASTSDTLDITVAAWRDLIPVPPGPAGLDFIRGVSSQFLTPDRDIIIYTPPGYDEALGTRYPVLYMHDGQNLMDPATSAFGTAWEIDDIATTLIGDARIEPIIIVGIYNSGDRIAEYTPVPDANRGGGNADNYGRFIIEELKPDIDATYRTKPEAASTGLAGSSLGGLVSMYLGLEHSEVFTRLGVVSPSVWWANLDIVTRVLALTAKLPLKIWLDIGTAEGGGGAVEDARTLRDALIAEGWVLGQDLKYGEYEGAAHNEAAWAARSDDILEALFPR